MACVSLWCCISLPVEQSNDSQYNRTRKKLTFKRLMSLYECNLPSKEDSLKAWGGEFARATKDNLVFEFSVAPGYIIFQTKKKGDVYYYFSTSGEVNLIKEIRKACTYTGHLTIESSNARQPQPLHWYCYRYKDGTNIFIFKDRTPRKQGNVADKYNNSRKKQGIIISKDTKLQKILDGLKI